MSEPEASGPPDPARKKLLKRVKLAVQLLVSACLVGFVFRQIDLKQAASLLSHPLALPWLLLALVLFNLSKIAGALRLNLYQQHAGILLNHRENLKLYYAGMFLNLLLPGGIGGDGYKILVLHRRGAAPAKTLLWITLFDRVSGLLALVLLACLLLPFTGLSRLLAPPHWLGPSVSPLDLASYIGPAALAGSVLMVLSMALAHSRVLKMSGRPSVLACIYALLVQGLQLLCMAALLACFGVPAAAFPDYLAVFLFSSLAATLPLSFGGVGVREVTFLYGLRLMGIEPTEGVLASSLFFLVAAVSSAFGALFLKDFSVKTG